MHQRFKISSKLVNKDGDLAKHEENNVVVDLSFDFRFLFLILLLQLQKIKKKIKIK